MTKKFIEKPINEEGWKKEVNTSGAAGELNIFLWSTVHSVQYTVYTYEMNIWQVR
jgi:hypothetical protein